MTHQTDTDAIVIGAGLAGLGMAAYLARAGLSVCVVERAASVGGRARTECVAGFALNRGAHALFRKGEALQILRELGVHVSGHVVPSRGYALRAGQLHRLPADLISLVTTSLLPWHRKAAVARLLGSVPRFNAQDLVGIPLRRWLEQLTPHPEVREVAEAYCRLCSYANCADEFCAGSAVAQLQKALGGVLYIDGGWQTLVDGLASAAEIAGASIQCGARAERIATSDDGYIVYLDEGRSLRARRVVLATPPSTAAGLLASAGIRVPPSLRDVVPVRLAALDVALSQLPRPEPTFVLGIDRPLYFSVHSAVARLSPEGGALIHLGKYLGQTEPDPDADRAELEGLLDLAQPGWQKYLVHAQYLPRMTAAERLDLAREGGASGRPAPEVPGAPGVFFSGDWVQGGSWLADAALGSARSTSQRILSGLEQPRAVA